MAGFPVRTHRGRSAFLFLPVADGGGGRAFLSDSSVVWHDWIWYFCSAVTDNMNIGNLN